MDLHQVSRFVVVDLAAVPTGLWHFSRVTPRAIGVLVVISVSWAHERCNNLDTKVRVPRFPIGSAHLYVHNVPSHRGGGQSPTSRLDFYCGEGPRQDTNKLDLIMSRCTQA